MMADRKEGLRVLIVGSGMYVCGIGTDGFGTLLPAVYEGWRARLVRSVDVVGADPSKAPQVMEKINLIARIMGVDVETRFFPRTGDRDSEAYLERARSGEYDLAIVSVPDHLHYEVTANLIKLGLHCLVVKPLVPTLREADELIALQRDHHVYCAVEFHKRFDAANRSIRSMLREKKIGDVLHAIIEFSQRRSVPLTHFRAWSGRTNIFQYLGVHYVDIVRFCTGAVPVRAMATGQKRLLTSRGVDTFDAIQAVIVWREPSHGYTFTSHIYTNWIDPESSTAMSDQRIKFIGTTGRIESDQTRRGLSITADPGGRSDINPYFSVFDRDVEDRAMVFRGYGCESVLRFLKDCRDVMREVRPWSDLGGLRSTFEESRIATAVVEIVNQSLAEDSRWLGVELAPEAKQEA